MITSQLANNTGWILPVKPLMNKDRKMKLSIPTFLGNKRKLFSHNRYTTLPITLEQDLQGVTPNV